MTKRNISKEKRFLILERDGFTCCACGATRGGKVKLEVDHHIPLSKGGDDSLNNLITLCISCNRGKGDKILKVIPQSKNQVIIPIPIEYSVGQVTQILREYRNYSKNNKLSIQQVIAVVYNSLSDGIQPLYYPLPKNATIEALMKLVEDNKISIIEDKVDFSKL